MKKIKISVIAYAFQQSHTKRVFLNTTTHVSLCYNCSSRNKIHPTIVIRCRCKGILIKITSTNITRKNKIVCTKNSHLNMLIRDHNFFGTQALQLKRKRLLINYRISRSSFDDAFKGLVFTCFLILLQTNFFFSKS
jgi:hypothetical protein